jgi:hypothetical protein
MTIQTIFARRWVRFLGVAGAAAAGYVFGVTHDRLTAQPGTQPPAPDRRIVAYVYGNVPVTREELGDFLIARGGYAKLDLLVNKKIIEAEAARLGMSVTAVEVQATLEDDLRGMGIILDDFTSKVLPRYGKTLFEWTEDVIKPRLLLGKMCRDQVKVTLDDLDHAFENTYGQKRQAKIICWPKEEERAARKQWDDARKSDAEFDRVARNQGDRNLAASCGLVAPIGPYPAVEEETCTKKLYELKVGELSGLFETPAGIMCIKCVAIVPATYGTCKLTDQCIAALQIAVPENLLAKLKPVLVKLIPLKNKEMTREELMGECTKVLNTEPLTTEEKVQLESLILTQAGDKARSFEKVRPAIEREVRDKKLAAEIPKCFAELKKRAQPNILLKGPPSPAEISTGTPQGLQPAGGVPPGTVPGPVPKP